jgi:hypothetical protein
LGRRDLIPVNDLVSEVATSDDEDENFVSKSFGKLPEDLLEQLSRAAVEGNLSRMAEVVEKINGQDEIFAAVLRRWLKRFHFEKIVRFVEKQERSQ